MFDYLKVAMKEAKKLKEMDKKKKRLLKKEIDYQFLEEIVQQINENPLLRVKITLKDGTVLDVNTKPKRDNVELFAPEEEFIEVR